MRFPGNCLIVAAVIGGRNMRAMRNRSNRFHFYWLDDDGLAWEFYKAGASRKTYWQNSFYFGEIRRMKSMDALSRSASSLAVEA